MHHHYLYTIYDSPKFTTLSLCIVLTCLLLFTILIPPVNQSEIRVSSDNGTVRLYVIYAT